MVPGNHDCDFSDKDYIENRSIIIDKILNEEHLIKNKSGIEKFELLDEYKEYLNDIGANISIGNV